MERSTKLNILTDMSDKISHTGATRLRHNSPMTDKSLRTSNYVQEVTSFDPPLPCSQHFSDVLGYICIDCNYKCLCASCLQEGAHKAHCVKSIEKGSKIVDRALHEALIRLRSKSDLLANLKEYMKIRKQEIFYEYAEYQNIFKTNFMSLAIDLEQQQKALTEVALNYHQNLVKKLDSLLQEANEQSIDTLSLIELIENKISQSRVEPTIMCKFYEGKFQEINTMVNEANLKFQGFKTRAPDVKWTADLDIFDALKQKIRGLKLVTADDEIHLSSSLCQPKKKSTKKNDSKLYTISCMTPKHTEPNKDGIYTFKSPQSHLNKRGTESGKLRSMPGSPSKQKTPKKRSPGLAKIEDLSRKFKKSKK